MTNAWDDMRRAKEEEYFNRKNNEALARLSSKKEEQPRKSPITGEPMEQVVVHGVVVDRCPTSGGIWLDAGELELLMKAGSADESEHQQGWAVSFLKAMTGK